MMQNKPKCVAYKECDIICANPLCESDSYMCNQNECQCKNNHLECATSVNYQNLYKILQKKTINFMAKYDNIFKNIQKIYIEMIKLITAAQHQFKCWKSTLGLTQLESKIYSSLNSSSYFELNSKVFSDYLRQQSMNKQNMKPSTNFQGEQQRILIHITDFLKAIKQSYQNIFSEISKKSFDNLQNQLQKTYFNSKIIKNESDLFNLMKIEKKFIKEESNIDRQTEKIIQQKFNQIKKLVKKQWNTRESEIRKQFEENLRTKIEEAQSQESSGFFGCFKPKRQKSYVDLGGMNSTRIRTFENIPNLQSLNQSSKIKITKPMYQKIILKKAVAINLLYRASENNFDIKKFWSICQEKNNTLTVVLTEFGKIIGGFTPLKWSKKKDKHWEKDQSNQSFLFSLPLGQKINLLDNQKAIFHNIEDGPIFGKGEDLHIFNRANQTNQNKAQIGHSYGNQNFKKDNGLANSIFCGNPNGYNFKIKQWEVFQVQFKQRLVVQ